MPTTGTMKLRLTIVEIGSSRPSSCTADGFSATSSCASRRAAASNVSPASTLPPGKLISPRWLLSDLRSTGQQDLGAVGPVGDRRPAPPTIAACRPVQRGSLAGRAAIAATTSAAGRARTRSAHGAASP